jgi:dihydrofolate synthase/folylpolyglutamate synthase
MSRFNTIADVWAFLDAIPMFQKSGSAAANFSLDNIRAFCEKIGYPQQKFPSVHVAGTNGKGTTCYLLEKIYTESGYKTGLFTSPHLLRYNERVRVNSEEISDQAILRFFQSAEGLLADIPLTYFEISTALAFWYFADQEVDLAIIETGLGGRLDSTNIIKPEISIITSIGFDHQDVLGETIAEIAAEKAGIIKQNIPVLIGDIEGEALAAITKHAKQKNSNLVQAKALNPAWKNKTVSLRGLKTPISTHFYERVNMWNVAMCWQATTLLSEKFPLNEKDVISAIFEFQGAPARFEKLHPRLNWYFSGSHNAQALVSSLEAISEIQPKENWVLVFSALKDKWKSEMSLCYSGFKKAYFIEQEGNRAASYEDISAFVECKKMDDMNQQIILKELQTELVIFVGSFYFYPIVKRWTSKIQH